MLFVMRHVFACALPVLLALALACDDKESNAPPPPSTGGGAAHGSIGTDASTRPHPGHEDEDGGGSDEPADAGDRDSGVLAYECRGVPAVHVPPAELPPNTEASTTSPADLDVTRLVGAWQGECDAPEFHIVMSEGDCPNGRDHALTFMIDAASLRDGSLRLGLNSIEPEPNDVGVRVRYVRPAGLTPSGEWGTCAGADGLIDLLGEAPSTSAPSKLEGTFSLELTACDGSGAAPESVNGTFQVMVRRSLIDYCPDL